MRIICLIAAITCLGTISLAGENLIINGDFTKGSEGWKGSVNVEFETPAETNKVCKIELKENDDIEFSQDFIISGIEEIIITFRVKASSDYDGQDYEVGVYMDNDSADVGGMVVMKKGEWEDGELTPFVQTLFPDINMPKAKKAQVKFVVKSGTSGYLMFDNITVTAK